jgi:type VI secretion system secreted protein VgrG
METYRIIEIKHVYEPGDYYNEFVGIPDLFNAAPYIYTEAVPKGEEQPARVVDNNDPMGMGRIRVQFPWQEDKGQKTPWIRLIQPHSGAGKGFHFIPEIGEEVLVGHESGNAEKPFVMGTHYNGSETSSYHTSGNDKKVIHTRSGTKIILNDAEGSVFIEDPSGNTYLMDGAGNINVNAPKNMSFTAGENISMKAGNNIHNEAGNNISNQATKGKISNQAKSDIENTAESSITHTSNNNTINAKNEVQITGNSKTIIKGGLTEVNGSINKLKLP